MGRQRTKMVSGLELIEQEAKKRKEKVKKEKPTYQPEKSAPVAVEEKPRVKTPEKPAEIKEEQKAPKVEAPKPEETLKPAEKKAPKQRPPKVRGKKLREARKLLEQKKLYDLIDALELVKKVSYTKFPGSVELHVHLKGKGKEAPTVRGVLSLPHGTGKKQTVVILSEERIEEIVKTGKTDFDVALATPVMMSKVAKIAKILGPKGKMPNPKIGTVTDEPEKIKKEIEGGRMEFRSDALGNVHLMIGKVDWPTEKLVENLKAVLAELPQNQIQSITLAATMGPGVPVGLPKA